MTSMTSKNCRLSLTSAKVTCQLLHEDANFQPLYFFYLDVQTQTSFFFLSFFFFYAEAETADL